MKDKNQIARWLKARRIALGYTQNEFARLLGMGRSKFISHELGEVAPNNYEWEGIRPTIESLPAKKGAK